MINILFSTYNGEKYLKQQVESLYNQTYQNFTIIARDDMSNDNTVSILKYYNIQIIKSLKNLGAKQSFNKLLKYIISNEDSKYFMFCDQDDVWKPDKIEKTLQKMKEMEMLYPNKPILVHTDLQVVDKNLKILDNSFWHYQHINPYKNSFNRLLMQNTITGCTIMINKQLATLLLPIPQDAIMHDWWIGLVASTFGKIGIVKEQTTMYRQHLLNDIGATKYNLKYIIDNFNNNNIDKYIFQAKVFLDRFKNNLSDNQIKMLKFFINIKNYNKIKRIYILIKYKIYKNNFLRNIGLWITI